MRDIRNDLRERIEEVEQERAVAKRQLDALALRGARLSEMLKDEEIKWSQRQAPLPLDGTNGHAPRRMTTRLGQTIYDVLSDGRDWPLSNVTQVVVEQGVPIKGKHPGRAVHFALVALKQNGIVDMPSSGMWRLKKSQ